MLLAELHALRARGAARFSRSTCAVVLLVLLVASAQLRTPGPSAARPDSRTRRPWAGREEPVCAKCSRSDECASRPDASRLWVVPTRRSSDEAPKYPGRPGHTRHCSHRCHGGAGVAAASSGEAVDGNCPPTYRLVPADSELRQRIDAATGSVDGFICAMELNERAFFDRNLVDNMAR
jgi:hypothetical protein